MKIYLIPKKRYLSESGKRQFSDVSRGYRSGTLVENGLIFLLYSTYKLKFCPTFEWKSFT